MVNLLNIPILSHYINYISQCNNNIQCCLENYFILLLFFCEVSIKYSFN